MTDPKTPEEASSPRGEVSSGQEELDEVLTDALEHAETEPNA